ncbi:MAG TPA: RHS repeat-associated core domain-containing protein [Ignavibacteria bacterium]|nr:RHS repeat-associated core domain-containing protein [Ignavibacteria bacterium]
MTGVFTFSEGVPAGKDHLGTIRVVLDSNNTIIAANDYDAWGFPLENRSYEQGYTLNQKYQFTGKERDKESGLGDNDGYDYFGARYYDSRIGRWGQVEPLLDKYISVTTYGYSSCNPTCKIDIDGKDDYYYQSANSVGIEKTSSNKHNYYVKNDAGNIEYNGDMYFKANSEQTVNLYDWQSVDVNFETGKFVEAFRYAAPDWDPVTKIMSRDLYVGTGSLKGGILDQKSRALVNEKTLYMMDNILYNKNEAGNIVWGAVMGFLYYDVLTAKTLANNAALLIEGRPDEPEEQRAIEVGHANYTKNALKLNTEVYGK